MRKSKELQGKLNTKRAALQEMIGEGKADSLTSEQIERVRALNTEINDLHTQYKDALEIEQIADNNDREIKSSQIPANGLPNGDGDTPQHTSLGEAFVKSAAMQNRLKNGAYQFTESDEFSTSVSLRAAQSGGAGTEFKTTMTTSAGFAPETLRSGLIVLSAQNQPVLQNFIPTVGTDIPSYTYMEETTFTSGATAHAEAASGGEGALAYTERTIPTEYVSAYIPISEKQMMSIGGIQSLINNRLSLQLGQKVEHYLLNGNGTSPEIRGLYNISGLQTQAKAGGDTSADAVYQGITKVRYTGRSEPDRIVMHPNDWRDIRLMKNSNGDYIWGNPSVSVVESLWGVPLTVTTSATENTGLICSLREHSQISVFENAVIKVGLINDDFIRHKLVIKISTQILLAVFRGSAFCTVTGI